MRNGKTARRVAARGLRLAAGLLAGLGTAVVELVFTLVAGATLVPGLVRRRRAGDPAAELRPPAAVEAGARWLTSVERRRLARFLGHEAAPDPAPDRALGYLAARWTLGLLGGLVLLAALIGAAYGTALLWGWMAAGDGSWLAVYASGVGGLFLLFLALQGAVGVAALERRLARHFLGPTRQEELRRRIDELASTRAGVVEAVHDERRRIERDLHDGVQQRLVALGMLLGRARRSGDPERVAALVVQAHEESRQALTDLREVAWRVHPTVLDEAGLRAALETVAERSAVPVRLAYGLAAEPGTAVRTVAYFVVAEAVTNAVKHSGAGVIAVDLTGPTDAGALSVRITDDGGGGADASGSGLLGLARRVAALDGRLAVHSPPGGPTVVTAELPCE